MSLDKSRFPLPLSCTDPPCGACCTHVGSPPSFYGIANHPEAPAWVWDTEDGVRWRAMPDEVRRTLEDYYKGREDGTVSDRVKNKLPCLWFDPATKGCGHYEWRPEICREFEVGGEDCQRLRAMKGITEGVT